MISCVFPAGEATFKEVRSEFETRREAGEFRSVQGDKYSSGRQFTTSEREHRSGRKGKGHPAQRNL